MKLDTDTKERLHVCFLFMLESAKVGMGTFLTYFVPNTSTAPPPPYINAMHAVALVSVASLYAIELKRENFCIRFFDIDSKFPDSHLASVIPAKVKKRLVRWNTLFWKAAFTSMGMTTANLAASTYYLYRHYAGTSTLTGLLSYTLLVYMKLNRSYSLAKASNKDGTARSAYMLENRSFNVMDNDVKDFDAL